jgi:hypothetical protein
MIVLGSVPTLLQDPWGELDALVEKYHSLDLMQHVRPRHIDHDAHRGHNTIYPTYADLPAPRLNQLVIPSGAIRWSYGLFLVDKSQLSTIYSEAISADNRLELFMTLADPVNPPDPLTTPYPFILPPELETADPKYTLQLTVSPLPPRPIPVRDLSSRFQEYSNSEVSELWVVPVVDARYWWQFQNVGLLTDAPTDLPSGEDPPPGLYGNMYLIEYMNELVPEEIIQCGQSDRYEYKPDLFGRNDNEGFSVILESICWHLGMTIVPDLSRKDVSLGESEEEIETVLSETRYLAVDSQSSDLIYQNNISGKIGVTENGRSGIPDGELFGRTNVGIAAQSMGDIFHDYFAAVPGKVLIKGSNADYEEITAAACSYDNQVDPESKVILRMNYEGIPTEDMLNQIARDYYARFKNQYDITFAGIQVWQPDITTDCIVFQRTRFSDGFRCLTRIRSHPTNLVPVSARDNLDIIQVKTMGHVTEAEHAYYCPYATEVILLKWMNENNVPVLVETDEVVTVWNYFEHIEITGNTLCIAAWVNGRYQFIAADCEPMTDPSSASCEAKGPGI